MNVPSPTIQKDPRLLPSEDYYFLRSKGIEYIEKMGSSAWTDYNSHDPGITLLEALCFAITDIGFHAAWDIKDMLAVPPNVSPDPDRQAFFTAREILSCNPLTPNDFRKILIDQQDIRNAWLVCKDCACEVSLYADCEESTLSFVDNGLEVIPLGTYDILLELEQDPDLGDLNNRKVLHTFSIVLADGSLGKVTLELRFPSLDAALYHRDASGAIAFNFPSDKVDTITTLKLSRNKTDNNPVTLEELRAGWNGVFYTTLEIHFNTPTPATLLLENISVRLFGTEEVRRTLTPGRVSTEIAATAGDGAVVKRFFRKMESVAKAIESARKRLREVRNLCEDFCCTSQVCVEDIAVCADIEVKPDADIERVMANILFEIEQYFNPAVRFFSLSELMEAGKTTDQIFDGPVLTNGFILEEDLENAQLKQQLRTSDIINRLADLDGVVAIKSLLLTKYDADGLPVFGVSDHGDPKQMSARWTMKVSARCQPRLYVENSKFLFFKNDLPFLARPDEVRDTLAQLRGRSERLKIRGAETDLPVPQGEYRDQSVYYPVQYSLPLTYGIGPDGLSDSASDKRKAQAKQLKAFLLFFEQLLANHLAQLADLGNLFALDKSVSTTYQVKNLLDEAIIKGVTPLVDNALTTQQLHGMVESEAEFLDRRNRFLDQLMGRFAESFSEYALALYSYKEEKPLAQKQLIDNKIDFLADYPVISRERARAINYKNLPDPATNFPGLRKRIARLLGLDTVTEEQILIVEHILLRPKFHGDALMQVCLDKDCATCGDTDPYSFQLTVVMPGWVAPFDTNLDLRRFADRTIRLETPAHILVKICWVGNRGDRLEPCEPMETALTQLFKEKGKTAAGDTTDCEDAVVCGIWVFEQYFKNFSQWIEENPAIIQKKKTVAAVTTALLSRFGGLTFDNSLPASCDVDYVALRTEMEALLIPHFTDLVVNGFQYDKFRYRWEEWLLENRQFEWCEMELHRQIDLLVKKAPTGPTIRPAGPLKECSCQILETFGNALHRHLETLALKPEEEITAFAAAELDTVFQQAFPGNSIHCVAGPVIEGALFGKLRNLLLETYEPLFPVTLKLRDLLRSLSKLYNVYPTATLHDCDDGSDVNPVRLDNTALG